MIIPFESLKNYIFSVADVKALRITPSYKTLNVINRSCNGLLYLEEGSCTYTFGENEFSIKAGAVVYLPLNSKHKLTITSEKFSYYRIDFTLKAEGEIILFSDFPFKITDHTTPESIEAIIDLVGDFHLQENTILNTEKICRIFSSLQKDNKEVGIKKILPAVKYIREHFTEEIDCVELSKLCFLGTSRFYQLFRKEFGVTPLEYRNSIILNQAKLLLSSGDISVKEIAFNLGFQTVAYFSRFFKKHTGYSPSEYAK